MTPYNTWQWRLRREAFGPAQLLAVGEKASLLVLLSITLPTVAIGAVDANYSLVDFSNAGNSSIGTAAAAGFEHKYEDVLAGVDAVLTVTDTQNIQSAKTNTDGKVSEVDEYFFGSPPGWATTNDGINTETYSVASTGESFTTYRIDFLQADTLSPITVNNIAITVKDLDDTEFVEFGGINSYTRAQSTSVAVETPGDNFRFKGTTSETSSSVSGWAEVRYGSANSMTMVMGTTNSAEVGARFGISFTAASWGSAATNSVTVNEPTYTITYNGNGNDAGTLPAATSGQGALTIASNSGGLSRAGVAFNSWNIKSDGSGLALAPGSSYTPSADTTLYAIYPATNSVPGAPTVVTAAAGNAQATVSWTAPTDTGGADLSGYKVTSSPGGKQCNATGATTSCTVTGLTNGTAYTFTVTATNAAGTTSAASSASNSVTPATVPGAPTVGTATAGNAQASVTWTAPADNGGSAVTSYTATAVEDNTKSCTVNGSTLTCTVTGLTNGSAYTFIVTATNSVGTSAVSSASNGVIPDAAAISAPGAPTNVTAVAGHGEATVSWTAPASNGGAEITSYTAATNLSCTTSGTSCTVTGLTNDTAYTFTVTATNAAGTSVASAASNSVTPVASSVTPATPVPFLSLWALWIFGGLLGLLGLRRLRQQASA